ncbi:MAG: SAM-dependent methyltransferase, partial [Thermoguttaceae bacterium]
MAMNLPPLVIVGCGPGAPEYLTDAARQAVAQAEVLVGSARLLALFPDGKSRHTSPKRKRGTCAAPPPSLALRAIEIDTHVPAVLET